VVDGRGDTVVGEGKGMRMKRRTVGLSVTAMALVAAALVVNLSVAHAAGGRGSISVVTYNVSGLPSIVNSAQSERGASTVAIGERLKPYDIINVQEDFNYHHNLYDGDTHEFRTSTSGPAGRGSGLNTLSSHPFTDLDRVKWRSCSLGSGDCLTPKGFTFLRVQLADGVDVDVYNLHADAGDGAGDIQARADNLAQVTEYIQAHSKGNAVLVMGDTNARYTRDGDGIAKFATDNGLTDAWVQLAAAGGKPPALGPALLCPDNPDNSCEVVDKVLYRGSSSLTLTATAYGHEHSAFLSDAGVPLSDHDPIKVDISWTQQ
jgi:endonuclease/exonuclease/phosphatase family metal-dependent hydrolase